MSMLEEAIIDAEALKEAAMKNAEKLLVEKYSNRIQEAVDQLLEQPDLGMDDEDELDLGMEDDLGGGLEMEVGGGGESAIADGLPLAATDGEELCPCAEDEEEIEIDFNDLEQQMAADGDPMAGEMTDREGLADELDDEMLQEQQDEETLVNEEEEELCEGCEEDGENLDEELDLDEDSIRALAEEMTVDMEPVKSGFAGTPVSAKEEALDMLAAKENDTSDDEADSPDIVEEEEKEDKKLQERLKLLKNKVNQQNEKLNKYYGLLKEFKVKLEEVQVINAKLLHKNKVLGNTSLNERQKSKLVESISKAKTVSEVKVIYEALQGTVGGSSMVRPPKSLNEAANRASSRVMSVRRNRPDQAPRDPQTDRMKILAGIK